MLRKMPPLLWLESLARIGYWPELSESLEFLLQSGALLVLRYRLANLQDCFQLLMQH